MTRRPYSHRGGCALSLRRLYGLCAVLVLLAGVVLCRTYWVGQQTAYAASAGGQSVQTLTLPRARGDFYDRTGRRLTGLSPRYYALCLPGDAGYTALFPYVPYAEQSLLYERRNLASPFLIQVDRDLTAQGITTCTVPQHFGGSTAAHLLGYLDSEGRGVSGLEKAYDDLLTASGDARTVTCFMTAQGRLLTDTSPLVAVETPGTGQGVRLTLDADPQRACEGLATMYLPRGCIVVMNTATGEVLASVSMPSFDPQNVAASIAANDTSLLNRPLRAFSAGSVFKVVLAAAAYESGLDWYTHDCTGEVEVAGQTYRCALGRAHGVVNLRGALEQSCNTYFIELGRLLGAQRIRKMAEITDTMLVTLKNSRLEVERASVDIVQEIGMVAEMFRILYPYARLEFQVETGEEKPLLDQVYFNYLVINLVDNAIKYGGDEPWVKVVFYRENWDWVLTVTDRGIGMPERVLKRIFRQFYRVKDKKVKNKTGFGLGLAFAKKVVNAYGGEIRVESAPGKGSRFEVRIKAE